MAIGNPVSTTSSSVASKTTSVIATAGQTLFLVPGGYVTNHISVFRNGIRLVDSRDYEARNGASVTLLAAATVGDVLEFHVFDTFSVADAVTNQGGTIFGDLTVEGSIGDITANNVTGVAATFTGAVNVGGVLTYEDVTNIDSVGIITARSDLSIADKIIHTGDTNTAIRFPAADTITAETGGFERFRITSAGDMGLGTNSPTNVSNYVSFTLNGTTGGNIEFKDDNTLLGSIYNLTDQFIVQAQGSSTPLAFRTNSAERMRIDSSGRLLLGTTTEGFADVADNFTIADSGNCGMTIRSGSSNVGSIYFSDATSGSGEYDGYIDYQHSIQTLRFGTNAGTERMRIDSSGNVAIGTNSALQSSGYTGVTASGSTGGIYWFAKAGAQKGYIYGADNDVTLASTDASGVIRLLTGGNYERMRIDSSGAVTVKRASTYTTGLQHGLAIQQGSATNGNRAGLVFKSLDGYSVAGINGVISTHSGTQSNNVGYLEFYTKPSGVAAAEERMRIDSSGRMGIGTQSPTHLLSITGTANNVNSEIRITAASVASGYIGANSNGLNLGTDTAGIVFKTGVTGGGSVGGTGTERMRIDSSGRLLVGTTAQSLTAKFVIQGQTDGASVGGYMRIQTGTSVTDGHALGTISFGDASHNGANIQARGDMSWSPFGKGCNLRFSTTGQSSTQPSERMRIDSSGRVMIGTTDRGQSTADDLTIGDASDHTGITIRSNTSTTGNIFFSQTSSSSGAASYHGYIQYYHNNSRMYFGTGSLGRALIGQYGYFHASPDGQFTGDFAASNSYHGFDTDLAQWICEFRSRVSSAPAGILITYSSSSPNNAVSAFIYAQDQSAKRFMVRSSGVVESYGSVSLSDEREKKNIVSLDAKWDAVKSWDLKKFHFNEDADSDNLRYGVIAQQIEPICPEVIDDWEKQKAEDAVLDEDGNVVTPAKEQIMRKSVKEQQMMWMAIKALQEAQARIETLETKVAALEG